MLSRLLRFGDRPPSRAARHEALSPQQAYAVWAETYPPRPHNPLMELEQSAVEPIIRSLDPVRALDVGTGTGRYLPLLAAAGARTVVGVDLSLPMLSHNPHARARVCGDARRLPFPDASFDLVCSSLMAGDVEDLGEWIGEAARVLAPNGHLVYSDFHPDGTSKNWRRTFRTTEGRLLELSFFPHAIEQHVTLIGQASLAVRAIREPRPDRSVPPIVVVFHAIKRGPASRGGV
jgi:malonyl-CoA O-methyltransferase